MTILAIEPEILERMAHKKKQPAEKQAAPKTLKKPKEEVEDVKPVKKIRVRKPKESVEPATESDTAEPPKKRAKKQKEVNDEGANCAIPTKKPLSEKQLASIERRRLQKAQADKEKHDANIAREKALKEKEAVKEAKRKAAAEARKKKQAEQEAVPPKWIKDFVIQAKKIEPEPEKVEQIAAETWSNPQDRTKIANKVKTHNHALYRMIFQK